jgi:NAD(P)-dependent dehydrogenase (short-subunit alcohol dehydrogenase family)
MRDLEGKTAVITGSASGMGLAFAECFAREGMNVVMADIEENALRTAAARVEAVGASILPVVTDVGDETSMDHLGEATRAAFGGAQLVCLNAGVSPPTGPMEQLTANDWRWTLDVNLWGVIHGIRVFLPQMKERNEGHFVVTASVAGLTSYPWLGAYNASKHAVASIAESLHSELREVGSSVKVSCLCPGAVATNIGGSERNRPKELANADDVSTEVVAQLPGDLDEFTHRFKEISREPSDVAERVLAAVVEERFWIETDDAYRDAIRARHRSIEKRTNPPARGVILDPYLGN